MMQRSNVILHYPQNGTLWKVRACEGHSAFMLAAWITLPHFSVSSAISLPKSAGDPVSTFRPGRKPRLDFGISKACVDFLVEPVDDFGRCVLGRADALPTAHFIARHEFTHCGYIRQRR